MSTSGLTTDDEEALFIFLRANELTPGMVNTCTFLFLFFSRLIIWRWPVLGQRTRHQRGSSML